MSDTDVVEAERADNLADVPRWLLGAGRVRESAERLKKFAHAHAVLRDRRAHRVRALVEDLARASEALPDDDELASWRRFVSRNAHRLERGGVQALVQLALDDGDGSSPGRAATRWLARNRYEGTWSAGGGRRDLRGTLVPSCSRGTTTPCSEWRGSRGGARR